VGYVLERSFDLEYFRVAVLLAIAASLLRAKTKYVDYSKQTCLLLNSLQNEI
jgi:hypothetical protein